MCKSFLIETIDDPEPLEPYVAPAVPYGADSPSADVSAVSPKGILCLFRVTLKR